MNYEFIIMNGVSCSVLDCTPQNNIRYWINKIIDKQPSKATKAELESMLYAYPFLQPYYITLQPQVSKTSRAATKNRDTQILCFNIGGNTKSKLTDDHPIIQRITHHHDPDILILQDTRIKEIPAWQIHGYALAHFQPPVLDNNKQHIGTDDICKNTYPHHITTQKASEQTDPAKVTIKEGNKHLATIITGHCRPDNNKYNSDRIHKFHQDLQKTFQQSKNDNKKSPIFVIGDFNARLGNLTLDHNKSLNKNGTNLKRFIQSNALSIMNNLFCPGVHTCTSGTGKSIIDLALTNDPKTISEMEIDTHRIFAKDHRPISLKIGIRRSLNAHVNVYGFRDVPTVNEGTMKQLQKLKTKRIKTLIKMSKKLNETVPHKHKPKFTTVTTLLWLYITQHLIIQSHGLKTRAGNNKWRSASKQLIDITTRIKMTTNQPNLHNKLIKLFKTTRNQSLHAKAISNSEAINKQPTNKKLKRMKQHFLNTNNNTTTTTITYKGKRMAKNKALRQFYKEQMTTQMPNDPQTNQINKQIKQTSAGSIIFNKRQILSALKHMNLTAAPGCRPLPSDRPKHIKTTLPHMANQ